MSKEKMLVNIIQRVNAKDIRTETVGEHEYIVLPSKTQPPGVVMNRLMYPGEQTDAKIETLNGKPAPIDHPIINGKYIDATDAVAALNFGAGVNKVVGKDKTTGAWNVEKWVNKEILENTKRGQRLQKAINEGRPIHTSTGVYLKTVPNSSGSNDYGEYDAEVEIIEFNHDAILPDSIGANTPEKGTGIFVNAEGEDVEVVTINLSTDTDFSMSSNMVRDLIHRKLNKTYNPNNDDGKYLWVEDFNENTVIFEFENEKRAIGYSIQNGEIELVGEPRDVNQKTVYQFNEGLFGKFVNFFTNMVKSNTNETTPEGNAMSKLLKEQLTKLGVNFDENATEADLLALHTETVVNQAVSHVNTDVEKQVKEILKANQAEAEKAQKQEIVDKIKANSELTEDELMELPIKALNAMMPKPGKSTGFPRPHVNTDEISDHNLDLNEMLGGK